MKEGTYRIVVGHALDASGDTALREAAALAARVGGAEIEIVHVIEKPGSRNVGSNDTLLDSAMADLRECAASIAPGARARFHVRLGEPAGSILQVALDYEADLVVIGTHGRRGIERLRHGSVAEQLVRRAWLPVLVARPREPGERKASERPDPPLPGVELHRDQIVSELVVIGPRDSHVPGLV
jgi:nucleotide-binding universal stress UspA family protein